MGEVVVVEFRRRFVWTVVGLAAFCQAVATQQPEGAVMASVAGAGLLVGVADTLFQLRHPLLVFHPASLTIHLALLRPNQTLEFAEIAAWAYSDKSLCFETQGGRRVHVAINLLAKGERARLVEHLEGLGLGHAGFDGISRADLERRERLMRWLLWGVALAAVAVAMGVTWWTVRRAG